ncbi:MAG: hypothetical protein IKF37_00730 [Bacilli bacterium]|nr:hypothetical protein [Bacilli bacterium]
MKYKYYYKGEPAIEYCKKHPEYKYNHLTKYISDEKAKNPSRDLQEIIDEFFETEHKTYFKIMINGMNLRQTCFYMGISYDAVSKDLSRSRRNNPNMDEMERVNMVLEKYMFNDVQEIIIEDPKKLVLKPNNENEQKEN